MPRHRADGRVAPAAIKGVAGLAALGALWLIAPEALEATVQTPSALLRVGLVAAALVGWSMLAKRLVPNRWAAMALGLLPAVVVGVWALTPYLVDETVDEAFPVATAAPDGDRQGDVAPADAAPPPAQPGDGSTAGPADGADPPDAASAGPVALQSGAFRGLTGHRGSGTATIYELVDGSRVMRLEDFDVSNGPGLEIHLVPGPAAEKPGGGVKLADLKGNRGNQNYDVPADLDLSGEWTVLIWCDPFTVEVAHAPLMAA